MAQLCDKEVLNAIASLSSEEFDEIKSILPSAERFALDLYLNNGVIQKETLHQALIDLNELISILKNENKSYILELTFKEFFKGKNYREKALAIKDIKSIISTLSLEDARLITLYLNNVKLETLLLKFDMNIPTLSDRLNKIIEQITFELYRIQMERTFNKGSDYNSLSMQEEFMSKYTPADILNAMSTLPKEEVEIIYSMYDGDIFTSDTNKSLTSLTYDTIIRQKLTSTLLKNKNAEPKGKKIEKGDLDGKYN